MPRVAKRVQCPGVIPLVRVPGSFEPYGLVRPGAPVQLAEPIPAGFKPVAVVECVTITSAGHRVIRIDQRRQAAIAGLGPLLAALREPSLPRPKDGLRSCMIPTAASRWFVLVSATGQVIHPLVPAGACGELNPRVLAILNSLHWIPLGTVGLHPVPFGPPLHGGPVRKITPAIRTLT